MLLNGIFGAAVPNLNHLVHGVGLGTGLAFGLIVAEPWRATTARRVTRRMLATTAVLVGLAAGVVATAPDASIRLREQDEENLNALRGLGLVQQILQQKSRIIEYYEQQAEASPGDFEAWMTLGEVLL